MGVAGILGGVAGAHRMSEEDRERRRREKQRIDRDPANKCQAEGCGNTSRLDERFCGLHMPDGHTEEEREVLDREQRIDQLKRSIYSLPDTGDMLEVRSILDIVGLL